PGLKLALNARIVGLYDENPQVLEHAAQQCDACELSTHWQMAMLNPQVDAVIVATPNFTHRQIVLAAVAAGKHVMCEKPLALNLAEAMEMYRAAKAAGVRHMTAFTY